MSQNRFCVRDQVLKIYARLKEQIDDQTVKDAYITNVEYGKDWVRMKVTLIFEWDFESYSLLITEPK